MNKEFFYKHQLIHLLNDKITKSYYSSQIYLLYQFLINIILYILYYY